jgi:hypothetical protein
MAATVKKKPAGNVPASIQEVAAKRMSDRITAYREAVADAAGGKVQTAEILEAVVGHLDAMGLPEYVWQRDIDGFRQMRQVEADINEIEAGHPKRVERIAELQADIERWQKQINEARAELHTHGRVNEIKYLDKTRRQHELVIAHPQLFAPLDEAVRLRMDARNKGREVADEKLTGWSE